MLLAVQANHKGGDVHHLLAHTAETERGGGGVFRIKSYSPLDKSYQIKLLILSRASAIAGFIDEEFLTPQKI